MEHACRYNVDMDQVFSVEHIAAARSGQACKVVIEVVRETGSTNADLMGRLDTLAGPVLRVAEKQTAGRGRAGRTWHMEPGKALAFSLAWKFNRPVAHLSGLPLAVGVGLVDALKAWGIPAQLKWPNDVLKDGSKLAGILVEAASCKNAGQQGAWAVIGIGLNLAPSTALASLVERPVAYAEGLLQDRNLAMATILNHLAEAMAQFDRQGLQDFTGRWNELHAYAGQKVVILDHGRLLHEGMASGIDTLGRLLLETASGQVPVMSGDISLRPEYKT
jgi:BirA family biotin operon repressor/biotin-[acetyl-CoA-carboxylase] ligase